MGLRAHALFAYGSLMASRRSGRVVAQHSGSKGHVNDQVVVLRLHEEGRVRRACYPAHGQCALEREDAEVINFLALQLRGKTGLLVLCRGIKEWSR